MGQKHSAYLPIPKGKDIIPAKLERVVLSRGIRFHIVTIDDEPGADSVSVWPGAAWDVEQEKWWGNYIPTNAWEEIDHGFPHNIIAVWDGPSPDELVVRKTLGDTVWMPTPPS